MPWLDQLFWKNPVLELLSRWGLRDNSSPVALFARARMQERLTASKIDSKNVPREDLLTQFLKAHEAHPEFMTEKRVLTMAVSMAFAGSETTAISLAAVFYYLLKNPSCLARVYEELATAEAMEQSKADHRGLSRGVSRNGCPI